MADFDYDIVFVGRGYSIATYLYMADLQWAKKICIIGGVDAWQNVVRGDAGIVNHAVYMYGRSLEDRRSQSPNPTERQVLVSDNEKIIADWKQRLIKAGKQVDDIPALVTKIDTKTITLTEPLERCSADGTVVFKEDIGASITVNELEYVQFNRPISVGYPPEKLPTPVTALKIVYGGGAGPHTVPDFLQELLIKEGLYSKENNDICITVPFLDTSLESGILDLDSFMRLCGNLEKNGDKGKTVALMGPNAGIDAAIAALQYGFTLNYLLRTNDKPFWLATKHYEIDESIKGDQAIKAVEDCIIKYKSPGRGGLTIDQDKESYTITYTEPNDSGKNINVDFIVYATGQDPKAREILRYPMGNEKNEKFGERVTRIGTARVLLPILDKVKLKAINDVNQRFGSRESTALGLQLDGTDKYLGLEVIGAAAFALAKANDGNRHSPTPLYVEKTDPPIDKQMLNLVKQLNQAPQVTADQLGVIRSQIEGITGFDIRGNADDGNGLSRDALNFLQDAVFFENPDKAPYSPGALLPILRLSTIFLKISISDFQGIYQNKIKELVGEEESGRFGQCCDQVIENMLYIETITHKNNESNFDIKSLRAFLPAARANVTDLLGFMEIIVGEKTVDFNGMDQTGIAVLLAGRYPRLDPGNWPMVESLIIGGRRISPYGYDLEHTQALQRWLQIFNDMPVVYFLNQAERPLCEIFVAARYPKIDQSLILPISNSIVGNRGSGYDPKQIKLIQAWLGEINSMVTGNEPDIKEQTSLAESFPQ